MNTAILAKTPLASAPASTREQNGTGQGAKNGQSSWFTGFVNRLVAARMREAQARMATHILQLPDQRLVDLGLSAQDIQLMRQTGQVPPTLWS